MQVCVFDSEETAALAVKMFAEKGYRVACVSNTGLSAGMWRYTFLPNSAFTDSTDGENK